jgi:outer membrane lipoprotein-sorting protein
MLSGETLEMQMPNTAGATLCGTGFRFAAMTLMALTGLSLIGANFPARGADGPVDANPELATQTSKLADLEVTVHVDNFNTQALEKIGKDFARTYALRTATMIYKQPDKMRLDGQSAVLGEAMLIQNGTVRYYSVPKLRLHNREDLKASPAKRQSLLEYVGLVTPTALSFMQGKFAQNETLDGVETQVYDMTYKGTTVSSHYRVWIDPKTHVTLKRAWFDSENKLKATFYYIEPHEVSPGVWLPTRVEVKNADGISAAITTLEDPQINQGLNDNLFDVTK